MPVNSLSRGLASRVYTTTQVQAKAYPNWMRAVLPVLNLLRSFFGQQQFVVYSNEKYGNRSFVLLQSDANRIHSAIMNRQNVLNMHAAKNPMHTIADRLRFCDLLPPSEDKNRLIRNISAHREEFKKQYMNLRLPYSLRVAAISKLSAKDKAFCDREIALNQFKKIALDPKVSLSIRLAYFAKCRESDKKDIAMDRSLSFDVRKAMAEMLSPADKDACLKCIWDQRAQAVLAQRRRIFPTPAPKPRVLTPEQMVIKKQSDILTSRRAMQESEALIKKAIKESRAGDEHSVVLRPHASICPRTLVRLQNIF